MAEFCNAVLVRYKTGYLWRTDPTSMAQWTRVEGSTSIGDNDDIATAEAAGDAYLAARSQPQVSHAVEVDPVFTGDVPGDDFRILQTVNLDVTSRPSGVVDLTAPVEVAVAALTANWAASTEDQFSKIPELSSRRDLDVAAADRALKGLVANAGGTSGGAGRIIRTGTRIPTGKVGEVTIPPWSWNAATDLNNNVTGWQPHRMETPARLYDWEVEADNTSATGTSVFEFWINGVANGGLVTLFLDATATYVRAPMYGYAVLYKEARIFPACTTNGGHKNGTIRFHASEIL